MEAKIVSVEGSSEPAFAIKSGRFAHAAEGGRAGTMPAGWTYQPACIDNHCHVLPTGLDLLKLNLRGCSTSDDVLDAVRDWHREKPDGWLHAVQYDQTKFAGAVHLTRHDLDAISPDRPILLRHSNGHASVGNSAALAAAGVNEEAQDPKGGTYVRDAAGKLTGVLLERAHEHVSSSAPDPSLEEMVEAILRAGRLLASYGFSTADDMMTGRWNLAQELTAYRLAAERGCAIRTGVCMQYASVLGPRGIDSGELKELSDAYKAAGGHVVGVKIFADGAIGSATAAIHARFKTTGGQGTLIYSPDKLTEMFRRATDAGWRVVVHSIGDRSTDHVMDAVEASGDPARHRIEHVMILSDEQILRLKRLGCPVTLQPEFLSRFGHAYRSQLPDDIWPRLIRARSLLDAGVPISASTDRPIVIGLPEVGINALVQRPEGYDPSESLTDEEALLCWTDWASRDRGTGDDLGGIHLGKQADLRWFDEKGALAEVWRSGEAVWRASGQDS